MKRRGAALVEVAIIAAVAIPICLLMADFAVYCLVNGQAGSSVQTMASEGQAKIPNGTDTSFDQAILDKGKAAMNVGTGNITTTVSRSASGDSTAITFTVTDANWQPNLTGVFHPTIVKSQTIYKGGSAGGSGGSGGGSPPPPAGGLWGDYTYATWRTGFNPNGHALNDLNWFENVATFGLNGHSDPSFRYTGGTPTPGQNGIWAGGTAVTGAAIRGQDGNWYPTNNSNAGSYRGTWTYSNSVDANGTTSGNYATFTPSP